jgi:nicotinamide mononucleotide transporter
MTYLFSVSLNEKKENVVMQKLFTYWKLWELLWLATFCGMAIFVTVATDDNLFGFAVFLSGILCVLLAAKGSIINYPVGALNTLGYAYIAWQNGLYGEWGLNVFFYCPTMVIGFLLWRKHLNRDIVHMRRLTPKATAAIAVACAISIVALGYGLSIIPSQNTPYIDAATNVLSIAATLLMMWRFREQWLCYITLNVFTVLMWSIRTIDGSPEGPLMIVMWSAYLVNAIYGMYNWTKGSAITKADAEAPSASAKVAQA